MRWKQAGRLPTRESGQVFMVDLIRHLAPEQATGGELAGVLPDKEV